MKPIKWMKDRFEGAPLSVFVAYAIASIFALAFAITVVFIMVGSIHARILIIGIAAFTVFIWSGNRIQHWSRWRR